MKAIVYSRYGSPDVLRCEEVEKPIPQDGEVLVQVRAASVNPADWHFVRGKPYLVHLLAGLRRPKVTRLGIDFAGRVEAVGRDVTRFRPGVEVFGTARGAFAEYVCASASAVAEKPPNVTFEQAASAGVAAFTALQGLRKGKIAAGKKVLINGAAGGVGTFAVQIAKSYGANVTGVCHARNVEMVRSIGADRAVDYTREDFTRGTERWDLILDCVGNHSLSALRRVMSADGVCILIGAHEMGDWVEPLLGIVKPLVLSRVVSQKFVPVLAKSSPEDLATLRDLMLAGKVVPVIDRSYGLRDVPDAVRYLEAGHARGKVVISVAG
ncbi:MAG TPA: NAD(P)-dependent alcohol dehydrogenase [Thermoanaerobaculia bacterium]|nr:NAD(P)-dependent alcohol dehydrogenase [Thermoanaerobaculia bacterium]